MQERVHSKQWANLGSAQTRDVIQAMQPKWLRVPAACRVSGLSRQMIFRHIKDKSLLSKHYMQPGKKKGIRFVSFDSLMALMEGLPE